MLLCARGLFFLILMSGVSATAFAEATPEHLPSACDRLGKISASMAEAHYPLAITEFGKCVRALMQRTSTLSRAVEYLKGYQYEGKKPLSALSWGELEDFLKENYVDVLSLFGNSEKKHPRLRSFFTDEELKEILKLVLKRDQEADAAEALIYTVINRNLKLIEHFAKKSDRYRLLLRLKETYSDQTGQDTATAIIEVLKDSPDWKTPDLKSLKLSLLHPYALMAILPMDRHESAPLDLKNENPFRVIRKIQTEFADNVGATIKAQQYYSYLRQKDNPPLPEAPPFAKDAVRVAFIDTGVDFIKHPELGMFLATGRAGELKSHDYADNDSNPWSPDGAELTLSHGSAVTSAFLYTLSRYAPDLIHSRGVEYAMWKTGTIRNVLTGKKRYEEGWENRLAVQEAILHEIQSSELKPQIVSVSIQFPIWPLLREIDQPLLLLKAPWLWVMSVGNNAREENFEGCLNDVPGDFKNADQILCVGSLVPGILKDKIAPYSNFGSLVDVYAPDYLNQCWVGTSCAAAGMTGVAAMIASRVPGISPQHIKEAILEASDFELLPIAWDEYDPMLKLKIEMHLIETHRRVRVFDPQTMLSRAIDLAESKHCSKQSCPK